MVMEMAMVQPVKKFRIGNVTASVWKNADFFNITIQRSYRDEAGEWKNSDSYGQGDLLNLMKVVERAEAFVNKS